MDTGDRSGAATCRSVGRTLPTVSKGASEDPERDGGGKAARIDCGGSGRLGKSRSLNSESRWLAKKATPGKKIQRRCLLPAWRPTTSRSKARRLASHLFIGTAIPRSHQIASLEASIRECMVNSSSLERPVFGIHSVDESRRCRQHRLLPGPKLSAAQPVLFRRADRASANLEVHQTNKFGFRLSRKSV